MYVVTWNERNNPDLPRSQVQHDARYAAQLKADLYAFQELGEKQDHQDFQKYLPESKYLWLLKNKAISLALKKTAFRVFSSGYVECHGGEHGITPERGFGWAIVSYKGSEKLCIIWTHMVSGAWSDRPVRGGKPKRRKYWNLHWKKMIDFIQARRAQGLSVVILGDLNRVNLPKLPPGFRSLSHHGLDHILWAPGTKGKGSRIKPKTLVKGAIKHHLYTDHLPVWAKFNLV